MYVYDIFFTTLRLIADICSVRVGSPLPFQTLFAVQLFLMSWAETRRWMDIYNPGSQGDAPFLGFERNFKGTGSVGYPGQIHNPLDAGKFNMREMQTKVIIASSLFLCT